MMDSSSSDGLGVSSSVRRQLLSFVENIPAGTLITGGHYITRGTLDPLLNEGTILSFEAALKLTQQIQDSQRLTNAGILVNDIGIACDLNACMIGDPRPLTSHLPTIYQSILVEHGFSQAGLEIFWERHIRNRAKKLFAKARKHLPSLIQEADGWWLRDERGQAYLLTRAMPNDPTGSPACSLIMAAYALEQQRRGYLASLNFYYVDQQNVGNIPNHFMIEKGAEVARALGLTLTVRNVYFTDSDVFTNFSNEAINLSR